MDGLIISVDQLGAKLGRTFTPDTKDFARAEISIWEVSVRARSVAGRKWASDPDIDIPEEIVAVVLSASYRVFKNPARYLSNQAGQFIGTHAQSEFAGDIFLQAERDELEKFTTNSGMWTQQSSSEVIA